jgi:hypothetical protein
VSHIESGQKKRLDLEVAARLAHILQISLDHLCGLESSAGARPSTHSAPPTVPQPVQHWPQDEKALAAQILYWHEHEGMSLRAIAQRLNTARVPTRSGRGKWYQAKGFVSLPGSYKMLIQNPGSGFCIMFPLLRGMRAHKMGTLPS